MLPISVRIGDETLVDDRDPEVTRRFLDRTLAHAAIPPRQSPMSMTGMINVGTGAVALGFAAEEHAFS